jgi:hypothetical protein
MRDPELAARAQRAAARLESAWERWRALQGMGETPAQPVVGYVGYALKEPWGQPRAVIGFSADEAERLAEFLERASSDRGTVDSGLDRGRPVAVPDQPGAPHLRAVAHVGAAPAAKPDILAVLRASYRVPSVATASYQEAVPDLSCPGSGRPGPGPNLDSEI